MSDIATQNAGADAAAQDPPVEYNEAAFEDGTYKGFKFTVPHFNDMTAAVQRFGQDTILGLLNTALANKIRTRVKNSLKKGLKPAEQTAYNGELLREHPDGVLFTQADAEKYNPEISRFSPNKLFKLAKEAFAAGDVDRGSKLLREMAEMLGGSGGDSASS